LKFNDKTTVYQTATFMLAGKTAPNFSPVVNMPSQGWNSFGQNNYSFSVTESKSS